MWEDVGKSNGYREKKICKDNPIVAEMHQSHIFNFCQLTEVFNRGFFFFFLKMANGAPYKDSSGQCLKVFKGFFASSKILEILKAKYVIQIS